MKARTLSPLLLALALSACPASKPEGPKVNPEDLRGWPTTLVYWRILDQYPEAKLRVMSREGVAEGYRLLQPDVITRHYDQIGPTAHGLAGGTDVYWVKDKNVFFFRSDCKGHHNDGYVGPFEGDPRVLLRGDGDSAPTPQDMP